MKISVEIRGIYATALSILALETGWTIARPSDRIRERLALGENDEPPVVTIEDREDRQGIILSGPPEPAENAVKVILERVPDALVLGKPHPGKRHVGRVRYLLEFPSPAKAELDDYRRRRVFTLPGHHYLKLIDPESVDEVEMTAAPNQAESAAAKLQARLVTSRYHNGREINIRHQKVGYGGFAFQGNIETFDKTGVLLKRQFRAGGTYDSLNLPKEKGDFGTVEIPFGLWWARRRYYSEDREFKGEIYNINTPAEFLPDLIYYVDLELDVVRWPDGQTKLVDEEILQDKREKGFIPARVAERAQAEAERVMADIEGVPVST